jgi:cytochrome c oxidase subunit I+III
MYYERLGQLSFWLSFVGMNLTFFPMHIVGLLGMPRREYTYPADVGWSGLNLLETIGAYLLASGLLLVGANLLTSLFRGKPAGADPFNGDTLEWATTSPPPPYNFAVIPRVTSPYPMWDRADRAEDVRNLARGELVLERGHETPASTVLDADMDEVLEMPSESWSPVLLATALAATFTMLLLEHYVTAAVFAGTSLLVLAGWHWHGTSPADSAVAASYQARKRLAFPNGWWGAALLVATEAALFGTVLASYYYLRFKALHWPPAGVEDPKVALPLALTGALVLTSVPMFVAAREAIAGHARRASWAILLATCIQAGYLAVQIILFKQDLDSFSPTDSAYGSIYFTLLALHHVHVLIGILLCGWLLARLRWGFTGYRVTAVRVVALYWYFVSAMAILVVLTQVSPSL